MAQLYRVGNPIDREERANLNLTLDDIQSRFSLLQSQVNFLAGGADTEALIREIRQAIEDAEQATENVDNAIVLIDSKIVELEAEIEKAKDLTGKGEWNSTTDYLKNNIVTKDGNSYLALSDNTNIPVTNTSIWMLLAAKGDTGKGLTILGKLNNPSQLPPTTGLEEGSAYYVGQDLYVIIGGNWENVGQIKGDPGSDANVTTANIESALGYTPANQTLLNSFKGQYEFRTATIFNRQIRITKPDASNRIPILLNSDFEQGEPITVSLDSGSTSFALKNVDGTDVTRLEKGFIEIVQTGIFFTLRNKGGLSQSDLDALITLTNEAENNESVLRTEYIDTVNTLVTPSPLDEDASWNDILLQLPNLVTEEGYKISVGTVKTTDSVSSNFTSSAGVNAVAYALPIDISLDFGFSEVITIIATRVNTVTTTIWNNDNLYFVSESNYANCVAGNNGYRVTPVGTVFNIPGSVSNVNYNIIAIGKE